MTGSTPQQAGSSRDQRACITVRDAVIDFMRRVRMTSVFANPGSTELPMFRDFPDDFRYVLGLQEVVAVGMADGYAQATRNAGLVNLHSAIGLGHALGAVFTAYKNQTPLVIIAGQQARSILPFEPFLFAERATEFPRPYVKWSSEPGRAEDVPAAIARAYYTAMQPPRGPPLSRSQSTTGTAAATRSNRAGLVRSCAATRNCWRRSPRRYRSVRVRSSSSAPRWRATMPGAR